MPNIINCAGRPNVQSCSQIFTDGQSVHVNEGSQYSSLTCKSCNYGSQYNTFSNDGSNGISVCKQRDGSYRLNLTSNARFDNTEE